MFRIVPKGGAVGIIWAELPSHCLVHRDPVSEIYPTPSTLQQQAQSGEVQAIEALLSQILPHPQLRFEVSRREETLYVLLTTPASEQPAAYALAVYAAIAALHPPSLNHLEVIDGVDHPQVDRWRQRFDLPPSLAPTLDWPAPNPPLVEGAGSPSEEVPEYCVEPSPPSYPIPVLAPPALAAARAGLALPTISLDNPLDNPLDPLPEPPEAASEATSEAASEAWSAAESYPIDPTALLTPQDWEIDRVEALLGTLQQSRRPKRRSALLILALLGLGLGLGAAVAQWRYGQANPPMAAASSEGLAPDGLAPDGLVPEGMGEPTGIPAAAESLGTPAPTAASPSAEVASGSAPADASTSADAGIYLDGDGDSEAARSPESIAAEANPPSPRLTPIFDPNRLTALKTDSLQAPTTLTLNAVGDIIPGTDYQRYRFPEDWQYLFGSIQHQLQQADIVFGNFESTLTTVARSAKDTSRANTFAFRTPPWYASVLRSAGFDVLSVANNHAFDFGEQGFADTIANIELEAMKAVGRKGEIVYTEAKGVTVAFIGFSHLNQHNTVHDLNAAAALVQEANQNADIVVVSFHAGKEGTDAMVTRDQTEYFFSENRGNVVQFSRTVIDHGADLVLGHGPHVPRAIELYQNKLIAYSLGNFLGYRTLSTQGPLGVSLILTTNLNAQGDFVSGRIVPVALDRNGVPYLDDYFQGVILVRAATRRDFPDTPIEIDDLGYIWRK